MRTILRIAPDKTKFQGPGFTAPAPPHAEVSEKTSSLKVDE
jgi:hypothetical protein